MKWVILVIVVSGLLSGVTGESVPRSFFVNTDGSQNCVIVVGENADASDIIEASRLAAAIGEISTREVRIPVVEEVDLTYEDVKAGSCIVVTPKELPTLWYFDDFGVYGNGNERFDLWETHEEIQLYIEDIPEYDPFLRVYRGNGWLDFSTIYRIDNVRAPPYLLVYSHVEAATGQYVTGLQLRQIMNYSIIDPYFVYYGYLPRVRIFREVYTVVYIDSGLLITGEPHLEYVYVYGDEPFTAGDYTITLKDVDVDHNKCYLQVSGSGVRDEFWMVLDPLHGFSSGIQEMSAEGYVSFDFDQDGVTDHIEKTVAGDSELDVWGHSMGYRAADLVIDGINAVNLL